MQICCKTKRSSRQKKKSVAVLISVFSFTSFSCLYITYFPPLSSTPSSFSITWKQRLKWKESKSKAVNRKDRLTQKSGSSCGYSLSEWLNVTSVRNRDSLPVQQRKGHTPILDILNCPGGFLIRGKHSSQSGTGAEHIWYDW